MTNIFSFSVYLDSRMTVLQSWDRERIISVQIDCRNNFRQLILDSSSITLQFWASLSLTPWQFINPSSHKSDTLSRFTSGIAIFRVDLNFLAFFKMITKKLMISEKEIILHFTEDLCYADEKYLLTRRYLWFIDWVGNTTIYFWGSNPNF